MHYNKSGIDKEESMPEDNNRGRNDLVLAPNEFAYGSSLIYIKICGIELIYSI